MHAPDFTTYQLHITLREPLRLAVGRLGSFDFPAGRYVYTGSARRNFRARVQRHLGQAKTLRWHIDYLLNAPGVRVTTVLPANAGECDLNQAVGGGIVAPGFGASDCRRGCGSHLKYLGW